MNYEVKKQEDLVLVEGGFAGLTIKNRGFTTSGTLRYDVVDRDNETLFVIYIIRNEKLVECFQRKKGNRAVSFRYAEGIDGNEPRALVEKILNFMMWY